MPLDQWFQFGIAGFLLLWFWAGWKLKAWVFGHTYDEMRTELAKERDWWREAALQGTTLAEFAASHAQDLRDAKRSEEAVKLDRIQADLEALRKAQRREELP